MKLRLIRTKRILCVNAKVRFVTLLLISKSGVITVALCAGDGLCNCSREELTARFENLCRSSAI